MADTKQSTNLLNLYVKLWRDKYGKMPKINRYSAKWGFGDVIDSVGYDRAVEVLQYYFRIEKSEHPVTFFFYNFDRMSELLEKLEADKIKRDKMRAATAARVKEWEELIERRSEVNQRSLPE